MPRKAWHNGLLDHLIRPEEQYWGHREAEGVRRLEIDDQLEVRHLLGREVTRLRAVQEGAPFWQVSYAGVLCR
jgi:hypothetical protein